MLAVRWIPGRRFNRLGCLMDSVVREAVEAFRFLATLWDGRVRPLLDVYEPEENVVVNATLSAIKAGDVNVAVTCDTLVIKGIPTRRRGGRNTSCSGNALTVDSTRAFSCPGKSIQGMPPPISRTVSSQRRCQRPSEPGQGRWRWALKRWSKQRNSQTAVGWVLRRAPDP